MARTSEVSDNFNRSDGALGAAWNAATGVWQVVSNQAKVTTFQSSGAIHVYKTAISQADSYTKMDVFDFVNNKNRQLVLLVRSQATDGLTCYWFTVRPTVPDVLIHRKVNNSYSLLKQQSYTPLYSQQVSWYAEAITTDASTITLNWYEGTTLAATITDTNAARITGAGYPGIDQENYTDTTSLTFDNFDAGTIGSGAPATAVVDLLGVGIIPFDR